jgi:hypothetical protein
MSKRPPKSFVRDPRSEAARREQWQEVRVRREQVRLEREAQKKQEEERP